jgi:hypothetical protein
MFAPAYPEEPLRPPLEWAGGKRWLVPHLRPLWESYRGRRLLEPFCGGLTVTLGLAPERALLNDVNPHLINFYRWLQRGLAIGIRMRNDAETYYAHRDSFNRLLREGKQDSREAAELFYYLNRTGSASAASTAAGSSMNLYLHGIEPHIRLGDSIYEPPGGERFDLVRPTRPSAPKGRTRRRTGKTSSSNTS